MNRKLQTMCAAALLIGATTASAQAVGFKLTPETSTAVLGTNFNPGQPGGPGYPFAMGAFNPDGLPQVGDEIKIFDSTNAGGLMLDFGLETNKVVTINVTYWGKEAGYTNGAFETAGAQSFSTAGSAPQGPLGALFGCGGDTSCLLNYQFTTNGDGGGTAKNGSIDANLRIGYFIRDSEPVGPDGVQNVFALFDDGGAGADSDFDDMIVQFSIAANSVTEAPIPAPLTLFLTGLLGLGFLGRFRNKRQQGSETTA